MSFLMAAIRPSSSSIPIYPDPVNLRLLTNDISPSTVRYRIINPLPGQQTVCYTNIDLESGAVKHTGCFTEAFAEVTTDTRLTSMTAVAVPQAGLLSATVDPASPHPGGDTAAQPASGFE